MTARGAARLVLLTAFMVLLFNSGARFAIGLLLPDMAADLEWSRSAVSLTVTVFMVVTACALPFAGRLVDHFGAGGVLAGAVVVSAVGLGLMSLVRTPTQGFLLYGVVFAIGSAGTSITPIGVLIRRWYPTRVGMANSIAISGMGLGQLVVISVLAAQLPVLGWRGSYLALGVATLVLLPLVVLVGRTRATPEVAGAVAGPDADPPGAGAPTLSAALRTRRLWLLLGVYAICGFQDFLIATHLVAFAIDEGVGTLLAGNLLAFMGLAGLAGVLVAGALNDRGGPVWPTMLCFWIRVAIFAALLVDRSTTTIAAVALLYGSTFWMTAPLTVVFAREVAAVAVLGTVSGLITMVHHSAGGLGAFVAAYLFDTRGSYDAAFELLLVLSVIATGLTAALRRRAA